MLKNQIFLKFQRFQKVFWNPRCYQHLWCLFLKAFIMIVVTYWLEVHTLHGPSEAPPAHTIRLSSTSSVGSILWIQMLLSTMGTFVTCSLSLEVPSTPVSPHPAYDKSVFPVWRLLPKTVPFWSRKLSPGPGRQAGLNTPRSTPSSVNCLWSRLLERSFLPSRKRARSFTESVKFSWTEIAVTLICLLIYRESWLINVDPHPLTTCLALWCFSCYGCQAWWRRSWRAATPPCRRHTGSELQSGQICCQSREINC